MLEKNKKVYVAGRGMVGSALLRRLERDGFDRVISPSSKYLDLRNQATVEAFFASEKPSYVFLAAAKVGGVQANATAAADFLYDNLMIEMNVIEAAYRHGVEKLMLIASAAVYPRDATQPLSEESLLSGPFEPTNEAYGLAKTAGIKYCDYLNTQFGASFMSVTPINMYGPGDNYDLEKSHVIPGMIRRFDEAKKCGAGQVVLWGTGTPIREFLYSDDMADACMLLMNQYKGCGPVNVGTGEPVSIKQLATLVAEVVGYQGEIIFDASKPDGAPIRTMDITQLKNLGWEPGVSLKQGLSLAYKDYCEGDIRRIR